MNQIAKSLIIIISLILLQENLSSQNLTDPRSPAEWEKVSGFIMEAFIFQSHINIPWEESIDPFIKAAEVCIKEKINFYVLDPDSMNGQSDEIDMDTVFANRNISSPFVHVVKISNGGDFIFPWARDHGPFTVYNNFVGEKIFGGFSGDSSAHFMANHLGIPYVQIPETISGMYYFDGGNWLTDGHGTFNITNISDANVSAGLVNPAISPFKDYLGIKKTLNVVGVGVHSDYWIKMIDEKNFIVSDIPFANYHPYIDLKLDHNEDIHNSVTEIETKLTNAFGGEFEFHYLRNAPTYDNTDINTTYLTQEASYTNSVILNGTVIVPQYNVQPYDSNAINLYKSLMPGYRIIGANCRQYANAGGAMHCISREIYDDAPIYIYHNWYSDSLNQTTDYKIAATIKTSSNVSSATLFWSTDTANGFSSLPMLSISEDNYQAFIPGQNYDTQIFYYIAVNTADGKSIKKPMVAPKGLYEFYVDPNGITNAIEDNNTAMASKFTLHQNYPNPFNPSTKITYTVPNNEQANGINVRITVYDILGNEIKTLVNAQHQAGTYTVTWDGSIYSSGVYFYKISSGLYSEVKKMILTK